MFGVSKPLDVDENLTDLPELENEDSERYKHIWSLEGLNWLTECLFQVAYFCCVFERLQAFSRQCHCSEGRQQEQVLILNFNFHYEDNLLMAFKDEFCESSGG